MSFERSQPNSWYKLRGVENPNLEKCSSWLRWNDMYQEISHSISLEPKTLMDHATWSKVLVSNRDYVETLNPPTFSFHWRTGRCKATVKSCQSEGCHPTDSDFLRTFTQVQMVEGVADPCYPTQLATYITANTFGEICQKTCRCYEHVRFPSISWIHLQYCASFVIL